jgi:hypothetical protein
MLYIGKRRLEAASLCVAVMDSSYYTSIVSRRTSSSPWKTTKVAVVNSTSVRSTWRSGRPPPGPVRAAPPSSRDGR